jgi:hypothetical protein
MKYIYLKWNFDKVIHILLFNKSHELLNTKQIKNCDIVKK